MQGEQRGTPEPRGSVRLVLNQRWALEQTTIPPPLQYGDATPVWGLVLSLGPIAPEAGGAVARGMLKGDTVPNSPGLCLVFERLYLLCAVLSRSVVSDSATVARQAPLSRGILQGRILE